MSMERVMFLQCRISAKINNSVFEKGNVYRIVQKNTDNWIVDDANNIPTSLEFRFVRTAFIPIT